ncbi:c-type cytochrome [Sedimenticola hydrogenitrophicus]|uniref:c-type cytochrome n=1 Tax=Sedimenticola hydrogenitrophicus TaxID=2967975 RepID=UPI0023AEC65A|nr:cytochrome c [Sedimenticola hydrogenitrophicus]
MPRTIAVMTALLIAASSAAVAADVPPQRQAELRYLLKHDCGSCHGMRLEGGLGPALTARRLAPYGVDFLALTIIQGRPGTPMPPWRPFISEPEAQWLATQLKQGIRP